jgi:hypothetical protein
MPERFHYSKPKNRLGEVTALADLEGQVLSEVNFLINSIEYYYLFIFRQQLIQHILIKVIMDGIIHFHQCKLYLWLEVLNLIKIFKLIH